ncbi:MAG: S1 RNA-binding domain-containing protein, partial [Thermogutta sp.]
MMSDEVHPLPEDAVAGQSHPQPEPENEPRAPAPLTDEKNRDASVSSGDGASEPVDRPAKRKILIGSQRDPAAYRAGPGMSLAPGKRRPVAAAEASGGEKAAGTRESAAESPRPSGVEPPVAEEPSETPRLAFQDFSADEEDDDELDEEQARLSAEIERLKTAVEESIGEFQPLGTPTIALKRQTLPPDLQRELDEALGDASLDSLIDETTEKVKLGRLEADSRHLGKILAVHRDNVFVELGSREQGIVPMKWFREPPEVGQPVEVRVVRYVPEEGLYELTLPAAAADVADWADLSQGMLVEAKVTAANSGGLEVQVNRLRGFIPISQIDLFRVEKPEDYVGQTFTCLVIEVNPPRKNLVLSRRAVLEREREQAQKALWDSLAPGQIRDGVIRKLMDFGAFVDIGGAEGLLHVSQMAWGRIKHPSELFREGQSIKVRIDKLDRDARKISLAYRDLMYNPWDEADKKYLPGSVWKGTVTRLMDFGAF